MEEKSRRKSEGKVVELVRLKWSLPSPVFFFWRPELFARLLFLSAVSVGIPFSPGSDQLSPSSFLIRKAAAHTDAARETRRASSIMYTYSTAHTHGSVLPPPPHFDSISIMQDRKSYSCSLFRDLSKAGG